MKLNTLEGLRHLIASYPKDTPVENAVHQEEVKQQQHQEWCDELFDIWAHGV